MKTGPMGRVVIDEKLTISKLALDMLAMMGVTPEESPKEYGVYYGVKLQPYHATFFAFRLQHNGGYARLASKAEIFRSNEDLNNWFTWNHLTDVMVSLKNVDNPNLYKKPKTRA